MSDPQNPKKGDRFAYVYAPSWGEHIRPLYRHYTVTDVDSRHVWVRVDGDFTDSKWAREFIAGDVPA